MNGPVFRCLQDKKLVPAAVSWARCPARTQSVVSRKPVIRDYPCGRDKQQTGSDDPLAWPGPVALVPLRLQPAYLMWAVFRENAVRPQSVVVPS